MTPIGYIKNHKMNISKRLEELSKLQDGWYNGLGIAPPKKLLTDFELLFTSYYDIYLPLPSIFPTIEGTILLEWKDSDTSVEVDEFLIATILTKDSDYRENLRFKSSWHKIYQLIKS